MHHTTQHPITNTAGTTHFHHQRLGLPGHLEWGDVLCVKTVRIEDSTVVELSDLFLEMFQSVVLPKSTIVRLGSVTSMLQQGSSRDLFDWL